MSRGPARGPHSGLCAAPFPMPCLTPSRLRPASQGLLGPQRPSSCLRAHQPRLGPLHQLQGGGLLSVGESGTGTPAESLRVGGGWDRAAPILERRLAGAEVGEWEEPAGLDLLRLGADKSRLRSSTPAPVAAAHPL